MSFLKNETAVVVMATCTMAEYHRHRNDYDGLCLECGEFSSGGVEPDAEDYACEGCEATCVMGVESAFMYGWLKVTEDTKEMRS